MRARRVQMFRMMVLAGIITCGAYVMLLPMITMPNPRCYKPPAVWRHMSFVPHMAALDTDALQAILRFPNMQLVVDLCRALNLPAECKDNRKGHPSSRARCTGLEGLCIMLRRFACVDRLGDVAESGPFQHAGAKWSPNKTSQTFLTVVCDVTTLCGLGWISPAVLMFHGAGGRAERPGGPNHHV